MKEYKARFPSSYESVRRARRAIVEFVKPWFEEESLRDIAISVGEALANAVEHGHGEGDDFEVCCQYDGRQVSIEISDHGPGFARWNAGDYGPPKSKAPRGYGIFIMHSLMDSIEYAHGGSCCRLVKLRSRAEEPP
jgi:anti-sigma regulatory factor (Ser/Thr protein kinase)